MRKLEELRKALEATGTQEDTSLHEMECADADFFRLAHNLAPQLLEAVAYLDRVKQIYGKLAAFHPFLADEFQVVKAITEKLK